MGFEIINRLKKEKNLTNAQLAKASGLTLSTLDKITSGINTNPKLDTLMALCKVLGCSLDDFDDESRLKNHHFSSEEASKIANAFDNLDFHGKYMVRIVIEGEQKRIQEERASQIQTEESPKIIPLRLSEQPAAAGRGTYLGPECFRTIYVKESEPVHRAAYAIPVSGDSMEPTYHDGDILLVSSEPAELGDIGIFTLDGQGYVKSLGDGVLISLNPQYDPIPVRDNILCNGKVIGVLDAKDVVEK